MPDEPPISLTGKVDDLEGPIVKLLQITSIDANLKQEIFITTVDRPEIALRKRSLMWNAGMHGLRLRVYWQQ
jgi:hypothetical protein